MSDLYFILNPALGIVKIGVSTNVEQRVLSLQHSCGVPLEPLRIVKGGAKHEGTLHLIFRDARLKGEWFEPTEELLALALGDESIATFIDSKRDMLGAIAAERRAADDAREARREERKREEKRVRAEERETWPDTTLPRHPKAARQGLL